MFSTSILGFGSDQTKVKPPFAGPELASRKGNSPHPSDRTFGRVQLRLHTHSPSNHTKFYADNVRLNTHSACPNRSLPTESHPPLRFGSRNPSSWRRSTRERGPKRSRLTQLRCRRSFDQDRWYDWVLRYVLFPFSLHLPPFRIYPWTERN